MYNTIILVYQIIYWHDFTGVTKPRKEEVNLCNGVLFCFILYVSLALNNIQLHIT